MIYEEVVTYEKSSFDAMPMGIDAQDVTRKVEYREVQRIHLCPAEAKYGCQIPKRSMAHCGSNRAERDI